MWLFVSASRLGTMFLQHGTMLIPLYGGIILHVCVCTQSCPTLQPHGL